ncbi:helix-turn-helix domain-containing protein, partial [Cutibacterium acnes]
EILDGFVACVTPKQQLDFRGGWVAMAQGPMMTLATAELGAQEYRVLLALMARLDFENLLVLSQAELAEQLGMQKQNVNRAVRRLVSLGVLLEGPKIGIHRSYRLNPRFGWKGSAQGHRKAMQERMKASRIERVIEGGIPTSDEAMDI